MGSASLKKTVRPFLYLLEWTLTDLLLRPAVEDGRCGRYTLNSFSHVTAQLMSIPLKIDDELSISPVARNRGRGYRLLVAANSATGFGDLERNWRNSAPITIAGAFFVPALQSYGGCAWETLVSAGFQFPRFANLRTAVTHRLATTRGSSILKLEFTMTALIPSKFRVLVHRRMALSALRANSSLSIRLKRYNQHMDTARYLESMLSGGAQ